MAEHAIVDYFMYVPCPHPNSYPITTRSPYLCPTGRQPSEERATTDGTVPTRATLRIIPTPERRLLLRESLAAAVAAAAAAAERRGSASGNEAGTPTAAPAQAAAEDAAAAGPGSTAEPVGSRGGDNGGQACD